MQVVHLVPLKLLLNLEVVDIQVVKYFFCGEKVLFVYSIWTVKDIKLNALHLLVCLIWLD